MRKMTENEMKAMMGGNADWNYVQWAMYLYAEHLLERCKND